MALRVAFQMDPIEHVDINADSSFRLALEAQELGHKLYYYTPDMLAVQNGRVTAKARKMVLRRELGNHVDLDDFETINLHEFDVVWLRQDPPFDMGYITTTHMLDLLKGCLLYTSPSPRDLSTSRMPSSA